MRLVPLIIAAILTSTAAWAQQPQPSPAETTAPASGDVSASAPAPATGENVLNLPVSLAKIREGLAKASPPVVLRVAKTTADFKSRVLEQQRLNDILSSMDFRAGPVPPGGVYAYEQQRLLWNPIDHPLMQPYAAFSGGELITLAVESVMRSYVGGAVVNGLENVSRARAQAAARAEVARAIADYCVAQPNRGAGILICDNPSMAR